MAEASLTQEKKHASGPKVLNFFYISPLKNLGYKDDM
jgi:hypothetical protein